MNEVESDFVLAEWVKDRAAAVVVVVVVVVVDDVVAVDAVVVYSREIA